MSTVRQESQINSFKDENGIVRPVPGSNNVLITSALPYVNNEPHLGNIVGSTLSADVYARFSRLRNRPTLFICGTDEYGTTTEVMAAKENVSPQALCDKYHALHKAAYDWFGLSFDYFGRTTTPKQTEICQDIFLKLYKNGFLEEEVMQQLYCATDKRFLADRYVIGTCPKCSYPEARGDQCENCSSTLNPQDLVNPKCSGCGSEPSIKPTKHMFIKLPEMQGEIEAWYKEKTAKGSWSANGKAFTEAWFAEKLKNRAITRDLEWGVPLPKELGPEWENKVMYVWFDAPIGYPSITANYTGDDSWKAWWKNPDEVKLVQFMGKDNVPFHTVLFPAYELGTRDNYTTLDSISTTDYLQYEGTKFSKSKSVGVFGRNAKETGVPPAVWRYYLLAIRPESGDSQFTWDEFVTRNNSELLNNLGNLVNRVVKFDIANLGGVVPEAKIQDEEKAFEKDVNDLLATYIDSMEVQKIRAGLQTMMAISARGNLYLHECNLTKALLENDPERCATVVATALNLIYVLAAVVSPFMPDTSAGIYRQLNAPERCIPEHFAYDLLPGHKLGKAEYLFTRIDASKIEEWRRQFGGAHVQAEAVEKEAKRLKNKQARDAKKAKKAAEAANQNQDQNQSQQPQGSTDSQLATQVNKLDL